MLSKFCYLNLIFNVQWNGEKTIIHQIFESRCKMNTSVFKSIVDSVVKRIFQYFEFIAFSKKNSIFTFPLTIKCKNILVKKIGKYLNTTCHIYYAN